jgi:hypothetical protein
MVFGAGSHDEKAIAAASGVNPYFVKDYLRRRIFMNTRA